MWYNSCGKKLLITGNGRCNFFNEDILDKDNRFNKIILNEEEKDSYLATLPDNVRARAEIARMKGLGEMDAEELNETTMDIEKRVLRKITVEDCVQADAIFEKLMGDDVEPRRRFIEENAIYVKNLDIKGVSEYG